MRKLAILAVGLVLASAGMARAQEADPSPRARELAARYVELSDLRGMMLAQLQQGAQLEDDMMLGIEALGVPIKDDAAMTMPQFIPEGTMEGMEPMISLIEDILTQAIVETYPEPELEALVAFYETEVGRSILGRQAALETRMTGLMYQRMPEFLQAMGIDAAQAWGGGVAPDYDATVGPTRQMQTHSPSSRGMSLQDIITMEQAADAVGDAAAPVWD